MHDYGYALSDALCFIALNHRVHVLVEEVVRYFMFNHTRVVAGRGIPIIYQRDRPCSTAVDGVVLRRQPIHD